MTNPRDNDVVFLYEIRKSIPRHVISIDDLPVNYYPRGPVDPMGVCIKKRNLFHGARFGEKRNVPRISGKKFKVRALEDAEVEEVLEKKKMRRYSVRKVAEEGDKIKLILTEVSDDDIKYCRSKGKKIHFIMAAEVEKSIKVKKEKFDEDEDSPSGGASVCKPYKTCAEFQVD